MSKSISRPIFVVGVPHSGNSWLGRVLDQYPNIVGSIETNYIWMWGNSNNSNDILDESNLTPKIKSHIQNRIVNHLKVTTEQRLCDKTPRNCLRIPFLYSLFPDAKFILVVRDGRAVLRSIQRQNVKPSNAVMRKEIFYRLKNVPITDLSLYLPRVKWVINRLIGKPIKYWGVRPPGWQDWIKEYSQPVVIAKQWVEANTIARAEGNKLPKGSFLEVKYEDLIFDPEMYVTEVANFLEFEDVDFLVQRAKETAEPARVHRWKDTLPKEILEEVKPYLERSLCEMGYSW